MTRSAVVKPGGISVFAFTLAVASSAIAQQPTKALGTTVAERLGHPADSRLLVIHAEDFGMAHSVNRATIEALEKGWVTSASILVPCPWFPEVARWAKAHPDVDLGVRLDLNSEWTNYRWGAVSPQAPTSGLIDAAGYLPLTERYVVQHAKLGEVETELRSQIERAEAAGVPITHLDTHMRTLMWTPDLFRLYWELGQRQSLPVVVPGNFVKARMQNQVNLSVIGSVEMRKNFPLDAVLEILPDVSNADWMKAYEETLTGLPQGVYQLSVHLGYDDEELQGITRDHPNWGAHWRQNDLDVVSSPEFRKFLKDQKFILVTWKELASTMTAKQ